jgi:hypothetical protein
MPWCPVCHAEYRAGVKVCRQCQAELVRTPPRPGEHYVPPAENLFDTAAEKLAQSGRLRAWGRQFVDGIRLFGESFRSMLRMRNAWLVLAILTGLATVAALRPPRPIDSATLAMMRETTGWSAFGIGWYVYGEWPGLVTAIGHVRHDLETGLTTTLAYFSWLQGQFSLRLYPSSDPARTRNAWKDPRLWAGALALTLLSVFFLAGMLHWVLATVRREQQTAAGFWNGVRQSFWPLLAWVLAYRVLWYGLTWPIYHVTNAEVRLVLLTAAGLALLPLLLTSKVIVVRRPPLYWAPVDSARIFAANLLVILGFAIPFTVLHDLVWGIDGGLHFHYYSTWDPEYAYRYVMPALAFVMQAAKVVLELLITTAFVVLVARWKEADQAEPSPPEAASA